MSIRVFLPRRYRLVALTCLLSLGLLSFLHVLPFQSASASPLSTLTPSSARNDTDVFPTTKAVADTGSVVVTVVDARAETPLPGVNVVAETGQGAATSARGIARLTGLSTGSQTVTASFVGYDTAKRRVTIRATRPAEVTIQLTPASVDLGGIQVTALSPGLQPSASVGAETVREIEADDTGRLLRSVPGVDVARRGPLGFDPNVRGLTESAIGVYIGGMRTFPAGPLRMDSPLSHVDPSSIASIEVVKGPYALMWGPGNMSAIRAQPRGTNPPPVPLTGSVQSGFDTNRDAFESSAFVMGRQDAVFYSASGAWRTGQSYETGGGREIPAQYTTGEARAHIGVEVSSSTTIEVRGGYQEQLDIDYPGRLLDANDFRTGMGQIDLSYAPTGSGNTTLTSLDVQVHAQQTLHTMDNENKPTFNAGEFPNGMRRPPLRINVNAEIQNLGGRVAAGFRRGDWTGEIGGDVLYIYRNATRPFRAVMMDGTEIVPPFYQSDRVWPGVTIMQEGVFLNVQRRLGAIRLSGTGRLDFVQSDADNPSEVFLQNAASFRNRPVVSADLRRSNVLWSGALTGTLPLTPVWSVSAGIGSVARPLQALELYSDRIPASRAQTSAEFQGNPFLDPERSTQVDLWLEGNGNRWSLQASGFARRLDNYVTLQTTDISPLLPLSPPPVFGYVNGEATFYGAEIQGTLQTTDQIQLRGAGSYLWGRDETLDEPALGVSPASASAGARWTLPINTSSIQRFYLDGALTVAAEQDRVASTRGEQATPSSAVADVQMGMRLINAIDVRLSVENVLDTDYTNHLSANNPFSGARISEPGRVFAFTAAYSF